MQSKHITVLTIIARAPPLENLKPTFFILKKIK